MKRILTNFKSNKTLCEEAGYPIHLYSRRGWVIKKGKTTLRYFKRTLDCFNFVKKYVKIYREKQA